MLLIILLALCLLCTSAEHIAIVGAGIGGSCLSYYLKKFGSTAQVSVIEARDYIGGRLKHVVIDGQTIELGGDAWASVNTYMQELVKDLHIPVDEGYTDVGGLPLGIWTGHGFVDLVSLLEHRLWSEARLAAQIGVFDSHLKDNYDQRAKASHPYFTSIADFLTFGNLSQYTKVSGLRYLSDAEISDELLELLVEPISLVIYDQRLDEANAFAALVSLSAAKGAVSARYGNSKIPAACLEASNATLSLNTRVTDITRVGHGFRVTTTSTPTSATASTATPDTARKGELLVDKVVLAAPYEYLDIHFTNISLPVMEDRGYRHWFVTFVGASAVNPHYFGLRDGDDIPDDIFTTANATTPWTKLSQYTTLSNGTIVFKIFANQDVSPCIRDLFLGVAFNFTHHWNYTFPTLSPKPKQDFQGIELAQGLLYMNGIESVAAAMEGSLIAARNIAQLLTTER